MTSTHHTRRSHRGPRGQALAEFALILPILLGMVGGGIDFARVFQGSMTLQTATRNGAEAAAYSLTSIDNATAQATARATVCTEAQNLPGFEPGPGGVVATCTNPTVVVTAFTRNETAPGANKKYPLVTVTVTTTLAFELTFPWPLLPDGGWDVGTTQSFSIMQGR
jgi:Flp pilus assembly protein TadG